MNRKQILTLLLAMLLLTSCGSSVAEETEANTDTTGITETETETEPIEYVSPGVDYDGATVTVAAIDYTISGGGVWSASSYCEAYSDSTGEVLHDAIFERNAAVMEELNIKLETYSLSSFANAPGEFKKPVMAGEQLIDYCLMNGSGLSGILTSGLLHTLGDIPTLDTSQSWWDERSVKEFTLGDTLYTVTGDISLNTSFAPITYFFNKKLIEDHSLEEPYTLVQEGRWTIDKLKEMVCTVAQDTNGNGDIDIEEDTFGICWESNSMTYAVHSAGVTLTDRDADGYPIIAVDKERAASTVEKIQSFMTDANVSMLSDNITGYNNTFFDLFVPALQEGRSLFFNNQLLVAMDLREMDTDFGILPSPKFEEAQENYCSPVSYWWATFVIVPVTNDQLERTGHVLDATGYYSQSLVTPAYIEKSIQGKTFRDEESTAMLELILDSRVYEIAAIYDWGGINTMYTTLAKDNTKQFTSLYASKEAGANTALQKIIDAIKDLP